MFIGEKVLTGIILAAVGEAASSPILLPYALASLSTAEQASALQWFQENQTKFEIVLAYPRKAPTSPLTVVVTGSETEIDEYIGNVGSTTMTDASGDPIEIDGAMFAHTYRVMIVASNANVVTWISTFMKQTLLRKRDYLSDLGLWEMKISLSDLLPDPDLSSPEQQVFQRAIVMTGNAFGDYPVVQPLGPTVVTVQASDMTGTVLEIARAASVVGDTFIRPDNATTLGQTRTGLPWTALSGTWGTLGSQAYLAIVGGAGRNAAVLDAGRANCEVSVALAAAPSGARLIVRATDALNYFAIEATSSTYLLRKNVAGSFSTLATVSRVPVAGDTVLVLATKNEVSLFINGSFGATVTDAFNNAATLHGIGATDAATAARFTAFSAL